MTNKHGVICSVHSPRDIILFLYRNVPDNKKKKKAKFLYYHYPLEIFHGTYR